MRKLVRLILFNAGLLALLLGIAWIARMAPSRPAGTPVATALGDVQNGRKTAAPLVAGGVQATMPAAPASTAAPSPEGQEAPSTTSTVVPGPVPDPADPLYNDAPAELPAPASFQDPANVRHAHLTFEFVFENDGPGPVRDLDVYVAIPESRANQRISDLVFSAPYTLTADEYGQPLAHFSFPRLGPGERVTVGWTGDVEIEARSYDVDPALVTGLDTIPPDVVELYVNRALDRYAPDSPTLNRAARIAAAGATNPYWIARNVHDYVARRLSYANDGTWDDAETVFLRAKGSCTEYAILYIALLRANGVPARYVAGTRQREEGRYVDTLFHRWNEVYLPPYGWVPVDVLHDDRTGGPRADYFGAISDERFVTTVGGGGSEYLGWNYHYGYRYDHDGERPDVSRSRRFVWQPYPRDLRVSPQTLSVVPVARRGETPAGRLELITTNGAADWSARVSVDWLRLDVDTGTTPASVSLFANVEGLSPGLYTGEVTIETTSPLRTVTVPVELRIGER